MAARKARARDDQRCNDTHRDLDLDRINYEKTTNIRGERMEALKKE